MGEHPLSRRRFLRLGAGGLSLPALLALQNSGWTRALPASAGFGKAKSCIVLFAWGGMSHLDTFDPKPDAPSDIRGEFRPIRTAVGGMEVSEHLPRLARQARRLAVVRSVHHGAPGHRPAAYWNLTGHAPPFALENWRASRKDWPCLGSQVARALGPKVPAPFPGTVSLPYPLADAGRANGLDGGFLGVALDPIICRPPEGLPYDGKSDEAGTIEIGSHPDVPPARLAGRRALLGSLEGASPAGLSGEETAPLAEWRGRALDLMADARAGATFDLSHEPRKVREAYGDHICGQSVLQARKLVEAGVPLVTVFCAAGDLNGSVGSHFDTHADNFNRLKRDMLPPIDQASSALLEDLAERGRLDETLVVWLTEFGRTPKINGGGGRDHYPACYSVAFAGGGIQGGQVYGKSSPMGTEQVESACGPEDLQETIFHALGIDPAFTVQDTDGRPLQVCDGKPLPLF
ncbi:MAG: DUF1501 domain-containing protein [Planctomycetota bacterium]|nr:MAG: DUF1501 domain-containing protein [Planctomycetota bacterium]